MSCEIFNLLKITQLVFWTIKKVSVFGHLVFGFGQWTKGIYIKTLCSIEFLQLEYGRNLQEYYIKGLMIFIRFSTTKP